MVVIFPFLAGALYGLAYILTEKALGSVNVLTYMIFNTVVGLLVIGGIWVFKGETFSVTLTGPDKPDKWVSMAIIAAAAAAPSLGWVFSVYAIRDINALYTAFGEVSYPVFVALFAFLLFGVRYFDLYTLAGGALILIGSFILVYGQVRAPTP